MGSFRIFSPTVRPRNAPSQKRTPAFPSYPSLSLKRHNVTVGFRLAGAVPLSHRKSNYGRTTQGRQEAQNYRLQHRQRAGLGGLSRPLAMGQEPQTGRPRSRALHPLARHSQTRAHGPRGPRPWNPGAGRHRAAHRHHRFHREENYREARRPGEGRHRHYGYDQSRTGDRSRHRSVRSERGRGRL